MTAASAMWNTKSPFGSKDRLSAPDNHSLPDLPGPELDPARHAQNLRRRTSHEVKREEESLHTRPEPGTMVPRKRRRPSRRVFRRWALYLVLLALAYMLLIRLNEAHREALEDTLLSSRDAISRGLASAGIVSWTPRVCHFVSPVEAYGEDLRALRRIVADQEGFDLVFPPDITTANTNMSHRHQWSSTGHLVISDEPAQPHPIPVLLARAEKQWKDLRARQSRNLGEAVKEYERRYKRKPPRGFDVWWRAVEEVDAILPDEYDRINMDLAPFFALPKKEMRRRMEMVQAMNETFTIEVLNGQVSVRITDEGGLEWGGTLPRAKDAGSLINAFAQHLPDMNATFSIFDQPQIYLSWARRASLVSLGLKGQLTTHLEEYDEGNVQLSRSCPPDSNLRTRPDMREGRSLVYDTLAAGDLCQNPYIVPAHGLTIEPHTKASHPRPHTQLLPLFSLAKTSINSDILITPLDQFFDKPGRDPAWSRKRSAKLAWRGSPTGISMMSRALPWRNSHRVRLHRFANDKSQRLVEYITPDLGQEVITFDEQEEDGDAMQVDREQYWEEVANVDQPPGVMKEKTPFADAANFFLDVKLAGDPLQCDEDDGTCDEMRDEIRWAKHQPSSVLNRHKFLLDVDGNGWSGRFRRLMSTNSLVIKAGIFTEWFQPHLIPWFHYVPAKLDYTDLFDILSFFRGSPYHPELAFDKTAEALAHNGKCFVQRMFRLEDLQVYMLRLFLEYARLAADEGVDMDFDYDAYTRAQAQDTGSSPGTSETDEDFDGSSGDAGDEAGTDREEELGDIDDQPDEIPMPDGEQDQLPGPVAVEGLLSDDIETAMLDILDDAEGDEAERDVNDADEEQVEEGEEEEGGPGDGEEEREEGRNGRRMEGHNYDNDGSNEMEPHAAMDDGSKDADGGADADADTGRGKGIRLIFE